MVPSGSWQLFKGSWRPLVGHCSCAANVFVGGGAERDVVHARPSRLVHLPLGRTWFNICAYQLSFVRTNFWLVVIPSLCVSYGLCVLPFSYLSCPQPIFGQLYVHCNDGGGADGTKYERVQQLWEGGGEREMREACVRLLCAEDHGINSFRTTGVMYACTLSTLS